MTLPQQGDDREAVAETAAAPEPEAEPSTREAKRAGSGRPAIAALAALLAVLIAGVATSPFWAPAMLPLLPWGRQPAEKRTEATAFVARVDAIERQTATSGEALVAIRSAEAALGERLSRLEAAARSGGGPDPADIARALQKTQQEVDRLGRQIADLGERVAAVETRKAAEAATGRTDLLLTVSLLRLREAVAAGRPYAAEYERFRALVQSDHDLAVAAAPLAAAAAGGIASRAALGRELTALAPRLSAAVPPPAAREWWQAALARLRALVTIRRAGPPRGGPAAVVAAAEEKFAGGDLTGAVASLETLSGANAATARPWLETARARLAAEGALARLDDLLTQRLGAIVPAAPATRTPAGGPPPASAPAKPGMRS
jgi:hypothetical protein